LPRKNFSSVKIDKQVALFSKYVFAISTGSKSFIIIPAEGLAFFTSAIKETLFCFSLSIIVFLKSKKPSVDLILFSIAFSEFFFL